MYVVLIYNLFSPQHTDSGTTSGLGLGSNLDLGLGIRSTGDAEDVGLGVREHIDTGVAANTTSDAGVLSDLEARTGFDVNAVTRDDVSPHDWRNDGGRAANVENRRQAQPATAALREEYRMNMTGGGRAVMEPRPSMPPAPSTTAMSRFRRSAAPTPSQTSPCTTKTSPCVRHNNTESTEQTSTSFRMYSALPWNILKK